MLLVLGLPAKSDLYHTSGEKKSTAWQWTATDHPFNYTGWAPNEPNDTGNFCFIWNHVPGWKTWDDRPHTELASSVNIIYEVPMPVGSSAVFLSFSYAITSVRTSMHIVEHYFKVAGLGNVSVDVLIFSS